VIEADEGATVIIKLLKPKAPAIQLPVEEDEPLASATTPAPASSSASVSPSRHPRRSAHTPHHNTTLRFDLGLARGSLLVDILAYTLIPFAPSGSTFIGASVLGSFGGGFGPAVQAIALELFARQPGRSAAQAGTLFGALSVLTASVSQVLGPALFGGVYLATVAVFPAAIFVLSACLMVFSLVLLLCVRLPPANDVGDAEVAASALEREATAVADEEDEEGRGRKVTATD
jgi:MFS family permease